MSDPCRCRDPKFTLRRDPSTRSPALDFVFAFASTFDVSALPRAAWTTHVPSTLVARAT